MNGLDKYYDFDSNAEHVQTGLKYYPDGCFYGIARFVNDHRYTGNFNLFRAGRHIASFRIKKGGAK